MRVLPLVLIALGLGCAAGAWHFWTVGTPALWSFAAPHVQTTVTRSELVDGPEPGGGTRRHAAIEVAWPPGSDASVPLPGMWSPHQRWHLHVPVELVRDHPLGSPITVRVVGGRPLANRTDLYELAYALLCSLFTVIFAGAGVLMIMGVGRGNGEEEGTAA